MARLPRRRVRLDGSISKELEKKRIPEMQFVTVCELQACKFPAVRKGQKKAHTGKLDWTKHYF